MTLNLPSTIHVKGVTFGTPRVGNSDYAALFDSKVRDPATTYCSVIAKTVHQVPDFTRVNNEKDIIPIVPGRFLGFQHVHGEVHIVSPGNAVACVGDDDATDSQCTISTVPSVPLIPATNILDHLGPYEGISLGTLFCD